MAHLPSRVTAALESARSHAHGRHAELLVHDGELRQTLIALLRGSQLGEHNSPPAATIQLLRGRIRVAVGEKVQTELAAGDLWVLTHERHSVHADEDSVFLLTTVTSVETTTHR